MRRLTAIVLLIVGVATGFAGLLMLRNGPALGGLLLAIGVGVGLVAWRLDRDRADSVSRTLPAPSTAYRMGVKRGSVAFVACLAAVIFWILASAGLASLHVSAPFLWSLLPALAVPLPSTLRMLSVGTALLVDAHGVEHHRFGRVPWSQVEGIRMRAITVKGQTKHFFELRVRDPDRYIDCAPLLSRFALRREKVISIPLQMLDGDPLFLFEAANRYRAALQPPAITGWQGDDTRRAAIRQAMLKGTPSSFGSPQHSADRSEHQRLLALGVAMDWWLVVTRYPRNGRPAH